MSNGCPVCLGIGRVLAFGGGEPVPVLCPECAGLAITPASADDGLAGPVEMQLTVREPERMPDPFSEPLDSEPFVFDVEGFGR